MSGLQPQLQPQLQPPPEPLVAAQDMQFWLDKAVAWGQAQSLDTQRDTGHHLGSLKAFLQLLLTHINAASSTTEAMQRLPFLGQFLGRLCWNPYVTAAAECRSLLFQSLWSLYSDQPTSAVERKANQWIRSVTGQLATEAHQAAAHVLVKHLGVPPDQYRLRVLRKTVALLLEEIESSCSCEDNPHQRCSCDSVLAASVACVPLVTCSEVAPLIGALLQRPLTCNRAALSQDFLDAVSSAYTSRCLSLEDRAVVSLWRHDLPSLEGAVLGLLESVLTGGATPHSQEQRRTQSLLVKACVQHCPVFLLVNDIFRSMLQQVLVPQPVLSLLHSFTCCFLVEAAELQPQERVSLKAFFPNAPQNLLAPLAALPSQMPREAWRDHLNWLSGSLQKLTEEEEHATRGQCVVFEAWFLLVRCAHWVDAAVKLLVTAGAEDCDPLLWLFTLYHHPTNRGHCRTLQLATAKEAWEHLRSLFLISTPPLPADHLQSLVDLLTARPQQPSPAPRLVLRLLVDLAVFSQKPLSAARDLVQTVVQQTGLLAEVQCVLCSVQLRLNSGCTSSEAVSSAVQLRIRSLQDSLTHSHTPPETH